jgi:Na+-translocating ferredoxin:NAD+ oxidoreductase RnfC subunit
VKLSGKAETFIVNAAECEPLLHKDRELIVHRRDLLWEGLKTAMGRVGAKEAVIGIKEKHREVIESLQDNLPPHVRIQPLSDTYPAGDEFLLVYDVTGKVVPPGGLPLHIGVVVSNVETLVNIGKGRPVVTKFLTVAGAVLNPVTLEVPIGTPLGMCIQAAGGAAVPDYLVLVGGVMMGRPATGPDEPVTKTTGGYVVLPADHPVARRHTRSPDHVRRIGRSACDQCSFCTELCPRYLLGHPIEPHAAMRALGFAIPGSGPVEGALYCSECNLCSLFSCPEGLDPKQVCVTEKTAARLKGIKWAGDPAALKPHGLFAHRRIPMKRLMNRLGLAKFTNKGPLGMDPLKPSRVVIPLKQHAGVPAEPAVKVGQRVALGETIGRIPAGKTGANVHASIAGRVTAVNGAVTIEA